MIKGRGKGKPAPTSKVPSKKKAKPSKAPTSNTATLKSAMMKLAGRTDTEVAE